MAFKLRNGQTPIRKVSMQDGVLGKANRDGTIDINKDVKDPKQEKEIIEHEKLHLDQMERGDLDYDDKNVYWKGKTYPRSKMNEGAKNLPWEKEVYDETSKDKNMENNFKLKGSRGQSQPMSALSNRGLIKKDPGKIKTKRLVVFTDEDAPGLRGADVTEGSLTDYARKNTVKKKIGTGYDSGKTKHIIKVPKSEYKKENPIFKPRTNVAEGYYQPSTPKDTKKLAKYNRRVGVRFISEEKAANK
tara:strand:- start:15 stop:749 length:735 start_codon:yes stop_codon:yes gene_type:complete